MTLARRTFKTWGTEDLHDECRLYLVTSNDWLGRRTLATCVAEAIVGGVTMVLLRQKQHERVDMAKTARELAPVCRVANVPLIVNDDLDVAKIAGVDGIHIGQSDISCERARRELGEGAVIGVTVDNLEDAGKAQEDGASYLMVGPIHTIENQPDRPLVDIDVLEAVAFASDIPVIAFGGLDADNLIELEGKGVSGAAFMAPILAASNIEKATDKLNIVMNKVLEKPYRGETAKERSLIDPVLFLDRF